MTLVMFACGEIIPWHTTQIVSLVGKLAAGVPPHHPKPLYPGQDEAGIHRSSLSFSAVSSLW
jgi:hypothetical protein